jgi:hypothetical protein
MQGKVRLAICLKNSKVMDIFQQEGNNKIHERVKYNMIGGPMKGKVLSVLEVGCHKMRRRA